MGWEGNAATGMENRKNREMEGQVQGWARGGARLGGTHRCIFSRISVKPHLEGKGEQ